MTIGRVRELAALRAATQRVAEGAGALLVLSGEAGIGKSNLLTRTLSALRGAGFAVRSGRRFADGGGAYAPWVQELGAPLLDVVDAPLGALEQRARVFERVLSTLLDQSHTQPVCGSLEDLHWADRDSLLRLQHVVRFGSDERVLLLGTLRDPDPDGSRNEVLDAVLGEALREPHAVAAAASTECERRL